MKNILRIRVVDESATCRSSMCRQVVPEKFVWRDFCEENEVEVNFGEVVIHALIVALKEEVFVFVLGEY